MYCSWNNSELQGWVIRVLGSKGRNKCGLASFPLGLFILEEELCSMYLIIVLLNGSGVPVMTLLPNNDLDGPFQLIHLSGFYFIPHSCRHNEIISACKGRKRKT